jgi:hypothetical protein
MIFWSSIPRKFQRLRLARLAFCRFLVLPFQLSAQPRSNSGTSSFPSSFSLDRPNILSCYTLVKYHFRQIGTDWREDPDGCQQTFEREKVWSHEKSCPEAPISCSYSKECGFLRRGQLATHLLSCPFRPIECKFCRNSVQTQSVDAHLLKCLENMISCQWCGEQVRILVAYGGNDFLIRNCCVHIYR